MSVSLRPIVAIAVLLCGAATALADTDVVVLGPAGSGNVSDARLKQVRGVLGHIALPPPAARTIDAACAADPGCLVTAGTELNARRVLAVTVADTGHGEITISVALVDVIGKEMVAVRDLVIAEKKLAKDLGPAIKKFLDEAPTDRAKALFAEGNQHFNLGEFEQALELYKRAYRIKALPAFQFNIAQCHRKLGHFQDAITMYQSYLAGVPDAANKTLVESLITESKAAITDAQKRDSDKVALAAKLETDRLETERKRAEDARKAKEAEATIASERRKTEQVRIARDREVYGRHPARKWTLITGGLGVVATATGGYFAVQSRKQQQAFDGAGCGSGALLGLAQLAACTDERTRGQHDALLANAFLIGGGAALLGSVLVFALDPGNVERPDALRPHVALSPTSIHLVMSW
jgi:hypothetical protein